MSGTKRRTLAATAVLATVLGGNVAAAAEAPAGKTYTCDALTSAAVKTVKDRLVGQGIDPSSAKGPIGLACTTQAGSAQGVEARVTGVPTLAYTCATAAEKSSTSIVFFNDCQQ